MPPTFRNNALFAALLISGVALRAEESEPNAAFETRLKAVLSGKPISDSAAFSEELQRRLGWGQNDTRLSEAQGRLAFARGHWIEALAQLQKSPKPSPEVMGMLAACLEQKGERYEAAAWKLRAARAYGAKDERALVLLKEYSVLRPDDVEALADLAAALNSQNREREAAALYRDHADEFARSEPMALAAGSVLEEQQFQAAAASLYAKALEKNPKSQALAKRVTAALKQQPPSAETAALWQKLWTLFPADTAARNRALAAYESAGDKQRFESLLNQALAQDTASPGLRLRAARLALAKGDRAGAFRHANAAAREGDKSAGCTFLLAETVDGDEDIARLLPRFLAESKNTSAPPTLLRAAARGLALQDKTAEACRLYATVHAAAPALLKGRPEALQDLSRCKDPAALALVVELGGIEAAGPQVLMTLSREHFQQKKWDPLAATLARLVETPDVAEQIFPMAAALAEARPEPAKPILKRLAEGGSIKAATLLGKMLQSQNKCSEALPFLGQAKGGGQNVDAQLAQCQLATGDTVGARRALEDRYSRDKDLPTLRALLDLRKRQNDVDGEITGLGLLRDRGAASVAEKIRLGLLLQDRGDLPKAAPILDEALRDRDAPTAPRYADAALIAGLWAWDGRHADKARRYLQAALKLMPDSTVGWRALGQACAALGSWTEAAEAFDKGLQSPGGRNDPALTDGLLAAAKKSRDKLALEKAYTALLRLDSNQLDAIRFLADARVAEKRWAEAVPLLKKLTEADPKDAKAWGRYGNALAELSDLTQAGWALQNAIDLGLEDEDVFINRARAYREAGAKDMAASIISFLLTRNPKSEKARQWQAKFSEGDGQVGKGPEKD